MERTEQRTKIDLEELVMLIVLDLALIYFLWTSLSYSYKASLLPWICGMGALALSVPLFVKIGRNKLPNVVPDSKMVASYDSQHMFAYRKWIVLLTCTFIYIALIKVLGSMLSGAIYVMLIGWWLGFKKMLPLILVSVILNIIIFYSFTKYFFIPLPTGILGF